MLSNLIKLYLPPALNQLGVKLPVASKIAISRVADCVRGGGIAVIKNTANAFGKKRLASFRLQNPRFGIVLPGSGPSEPGPTHAPPKLGRTLFAQL
jgi:hypothetical protein